MHTLEQISAFVSVYEQGSYSAAGKVLGKARTTVREHVMAYEDLVGYPLFVIEGRKAVPTEKAKHLYHNAKVVEKQNRALYTQSQALFENEITTVNLIYDVITPLALMTSIEQQIARHFPALTINWMHRTRGRSLELLINGDADIAIMPYRRKIFPEKEVAWKYVGQVGVGCFVRPDSELATIPRLKLNHLMLETQYITENLRGQELSYTRVSPKIHVVSNSDLLCELLQVQGWAAMPCHYMQKYVDQGLLTELELEEIGDGALFGLNAFYSHGKDNHPVYGTILDWIEEWGKANLR